MAIYVQSGSGSFCNDATAEGLRSACNAVAITACHTAQGHTHCTASSAAATTALMASSAQYPQTIVCCRGPVASPTGVLTATTATATATASATATATAAAAARTVQSAVQRS